MIELTCASCGRAFPVRPQSPKQTYCGALECQRERRRRWNRVKLRTDPDYRANQAAAQRAWHARNPEYWQTYRGKRKPGAVTPAPQRTLATIDASSCGADPDAGICWMEVCTPGPDGVPRAVEYRGEAHRGGDGLDPVCNRLCLLRFHRRGSQPVATAGPLGS